MKRHAHLGTVFLTLLIDLIGFSLIFPLFPSMLQYYLEQEGGSGFLGASLSFLKNLTLGTGSQSDFLVTVLFGGCMAGLYSLLQFIFAPIWGGLSDRVGRRPIVLSSITGTVVGYALWVFSGSFALLFASRMITGAMSANMSVATAAVADLTSSKERAKGMALIGIAFGLGFILGPTIGGFSAKINLLTYYPNWAAWGINPFSVPAIIALALSLLNLIWVLIAFGETLPKSKRLIQPLTTPWKRFTSFIYAQNPSVRQASWVNFCFILAFSGMEFSLNFLAKERLNFTPAENGGLFAYVGLIMIATQGGLVRRLAPKFGEKPLCLAGMMIGIIGFIGLSMAHTKGLFFLAAGFVALASGLMNALMALTSLYSTADNQGRDMGIFRSAASLGRAIGPLLAAFLYFWAGSLTTYAGGALALILPLALAYRLPAAKENCM